MPPGEARRAALRQFGPLDPVRQQCYALGKVRQDNILRREYVGGWLRDVRFAVRVLLKAKVSTAAAILILAVGIGANTAVFTLLDRLLLGPLPVPNPSQLQLISCSGPVRYPDGSRGTMNCRYDDYLYLRDRNRAFSGLAAEGGLRAREGRGNERIERPADVTSVSGNFFAVLGKRARMGRVLAPADDSPGAPPVAVASYRFWSSRYQQASDVLGRVVYLNDVPFVIVGVLPRGSTGLYKGRDPDLYVPLESQTRLYSGDPLNSSAIQMLGRLRPGQSPRGAQANLQAVLDEDLAAATPPPGGRLRMEAAGARIESADGSRGIAGASGEKRRSLLLVGGIVALLLVMSCCNVACLLVARGAARQHEFAIRLALGAGRARVLRQCLIESCLLALAGGAAGLLTVLGAGRLLLIALHWADRPIDLSPDGRVLAFGLGLSLATGILFGLAPAFHLLRGGRAALHGSGMPGFGSGRALVVAEVALSLAMVAGATVFLRSFLNLRSVPVGFSPERVSAIELAYAGHPDTLKAPFEEAEDLAETLRGAPGVESAGVSSLLTFADGRIGFVLTVPEDAHVPGRQANLLQVDGGYFGALRIARIAGRTFTPRDNQHAAKVAILSEGTARRVFGSRNPLGRRILVGMSTNPQPEDEAEIVGIVQDIKFTNVTIPAPDVVFVPLLQKPNLGAATSTAKLQLRTAMAPADVAALVRGRIRERHLPVTVESVTPLASAIGASMADDRLRMQASGLFAALALLLITVGIYGLIAYSVARRTREMGVRMAVGSKPGAIVRLVLQETVRLVLVGVAIGIPGAIAIMRAVSGMLFGLAPVDPVSLGAASLALCLTGIAAGVVPAWRAARLDPVQALRVE
jgi:predicted permease